MFTDARVSVELTSLPTLSVHLKVRGGKQASRKTSDYLLTGDKEQKIALSISPSSKPLVTRTLAYEEYSSIVCGLREEREIDIRCGIMHTYCGLRRKKFYINKYSESSDRDIRSQMRILSVNQSDYYFKEDYTIVPKPRAVVYRDRNDQRKLMRLNELHKFSDGTLTNHGKNTMAEQNVPAQPPTRTDEQIVPRSQWLTIGKSNLLFNAQKIQKNPIFQISVDILSNTNFFQAFTASANVPAIYLQQFWKTMSYNEKTGVYSCQVDEQWFDLSADLLRKALAITPVNPTHPFELPPSGDTVIDFVNELGYPEPVEIVSSIRVNYVYQPWRAILSLLNQCLTGKTSGSDKPRHPVLQMLWGIVTQTNVDHAELIWEEFTQGIQTFFSHKASHKASLKNPKKKVTPLLIPYGRFSKVIIYYLASNNNIHRRPDSAVHHTGDDYILGNLKFVPKGESVEVFGMAIPDPLITEAIQQSSYYPKYLKMVAENTKKTPQESASVQPATKRATPKKPTSTTPVKQTKPAPPPTKKLSKRKLPQKVRKGKPAFQLVDEEDEAQQESIPQREDDDPDLDLAKKLSLEAHQEKGEEEGNDPDLELAKKLSLETPQEKGEGEGDDADLERAIKLSLDPAFLPQGRAPVGGVTIRDPKKRTTDQFILVRRDQTPPDSTTGPSSQPEDDTSEKVIHESSSTSDSERTESETETAAPKGDKDQGSGWTDLEPERRPSLDRPLDERVIDDKPESHSGSMSSMKNLDDTFNFGDQFLHDKPTEDDQEKSKIREELIPPYDS
ncbi:hypothetical protein Tco_0503117 [Tanacetum coccineum]